MAKPGKKGIEYQNKQSRWELMRALEGGTEAMRAAGELYSPKEVRESARKYQARLERSFLYPIFRDTLEKLVSKPFSRPVITENGNEFTESIEGNADFEGSDLTQFARHTFTNMIRFGRAHVLVDMPASVGQSITLADEKLLNRRPYFVQIPADRLLSWREQKVNGVKILEHVDFEQDVLVENESGEDEIQVEVVRYTRQEVVTYRKQNGEYAERSRVPHTFGEVPIVTMYAQRTGFMTSDIPLEDLAFLNLAHWQSSSDQRNILHYARCAMLFAAGFEEDEVKKLVIGPNSIASSKNIEAKLLWVEQNGNAIRLGADDLTKLEENAEVLGLQPLVSRSASSTATGKIIDTEQAETDMQAWIRSCELGLLQCYQFAGRWMSREIPEAFTVGIFSEFGIGGKTIEEANFLHRIRGTGDISHKTFLEEIKRRSVLSENVDIDEEIDSAQTEAPELEA